MGTKSRTVDGKRWRQWTAEEAQTALEELARSGTSLREFARSKGVSAHRFGYWRKRLAQARPPAFVAVTLPSTTSPRGPIEIVVGGVTVRVPDDGDTERVAGLVKALVRGFSGC
ncbi:MAG: IS66 family insertion sequence element accessory protein TnpA [Candidatus Rokuibacteriota bacterium]